MRARRFLGLIVGVALGASLQAGAVEAAPEQLEGHGGPVKSVVAAENGGLLLTASFDYAVVFWQIMGDDYRILQRLIGHDAAVNDVAFVPGGRKAVSVADDGTAIVWDLYGGKVLGRFGQTPVKALDVEVSSDGRYAAVAKWDRRVLLIDLEAMTIGLDEREAFQWQTTDNVLVVHIASCAAKAGAKVGIADLGRAEGDHFVVRCETGGQTGERTAEAVTGDEEGPGDVIQAA